MPKKVDHEARRQEIADALWRIAVARGLDGVSLRDVAAEADISLGRLQHYFRTKDEMLLFAMRSVSARADERIRERIEAVAGAVAEGVLAVPPPRIVLREVLAGMLPLDERSTVGALVGAAYFARAVHDERLQAEAREGIPGLAAFLGDLLSRVHEEGGLRAEYADADPKDEAMRLISLVDGLSTYILLGVHSGETALGLLDGQLERMWTDGR
ncbi:TetR family transcriptional regulator [Streptomyces spiroverticillatus]|uniref:TetR family transcriptional regulator n=1 Tax=Streptomyces finlayi TaxID=67296 RepID=A0A919CD46_9ACTN|nr:TetR/AcrR family transcriptional regulator [Streptomyces finlayi]GHA27093.1 TetR family transcriptional regulator [Streptomyces spiroverticillatus]GHD08353.1 TetR family transcriptional regulator [Streptomyces finlayi]